jgi:hypothetical protein
LSETCYFCKPSEQGGCDSVQPYGEFYECSRAKGHKGQHVACGGSTNHDLGRWPQAQATKPKETFTPCGIPKFAEEIERILEL